MKKIKEKKKMKTATKVRIGIVAGLVLVCFLLLSPLCAIKNIVVNTEDAALKLNVLQQLSNAYGENGFLYVVKNIHGFKNVDSVFSLRAKEVEDKMAFEMPELKNVTVAFSFPNTLKVDFSKRTPAYLVFASGVYVCADEEGFILSVHVDESERDLPVIKGLDLPSYKIGQTISTENKEQMKVLDALFYEIVLSDAQEEEYKLSTHVEFVDVSEYNEIWLFVDENFSVNLGDIDNIGYKIPALKEILQAEEMQGKKGLIDFTVSDQPVFRAQH